jgi:hypothetical protein
MADLKTIEGIRQNKTIEGIRQKNDMAILE